MRNKRGQFYLIAAIIIIAVLFGVAALTNYARTSEKSIKIYDLGDELGIETGYVYDYGTYNTGDIELEDLIQNWTDDYFNYTLSQEVIEDFVFVYGNKEDVRAVTFFTTEVGEISIGSSIIPIEKREKKSISDVNVADNKVIVKVNDLRYEFELKEGENFFFILSSGGKVAGVKEPKVV